MNINSLDNNLQALNAQMQSYFASQDQLIYSNSFRISNIGSDAEPIDENKLYIRTNYTIPYRINSNETTMSMPPGSYMIVDNAMARSMGVAENSVYQGQYVIQYSPITGNIYWDNGVLYAPHYSIGGVDAIESNANARWFYTDEFRNTYTQGPKLMLPGDVYGYTLEVNTEYVPNAGQSAYESNFNFVHDGNLITENADINQLRGRDVSVIINNSNLEHSNFESPTLVNSRLYNANMSLNNLDNVSPSRLTTAISNGSISNSNFYNASLDRYAYINEFTAIDVNANWVDHDIYNKQFEWDSLNVSNVNYSDSWILDSRYVKLPYIADNSVLAANDNVVTTSNVEFATAHQASDYEGTYSALYQAALHDFNAFVNASENQFNNLADNRGAEEYQQLYDRINNTEFTLADDIGNFWNSYLNTWNNLQNVAQIELKNMCNYPISNVPFTANDLNNTFSNQGRSWITAFDVAFKNNIPNNYGETWATSIFNNDVKWYYWGNNSFNNIMDFQGRLYTGNGNLVTKYLQGYVWTQNNTSNLFANCTNLTIARNYIPLGLVNASNMFANCTNLNMPVSFYSETVNNLYQFVNYCSNIGNINIIANQNLDITRIAGYSGRNLQSVNITSLTPNKTISASRAFYSSSSITDINISNLLITNASSMCEACYGLRNFAGDLNTANNLSSTFNRCYNLQGNFNISINNSSINAEEVFASTGPINVNITFTHSDDASSASLNMVRMFNNSKARSIDLTVVMPNCRPSGGLSRLNDVITTNCNNLTSIRYTFAGCDDTKGYIFNTNNFIYNCNLPTNCNIYFKPLNLVGASQINTTNMVLSYPSIDTLNIDLSEWVGTMPFSDDSFYFNHINNLIITFGNAAHQATISNWLHYNSVDRVDLYNK